MEEICHYVLSDIHLEFMPHITTLNDLINKSCLKHDKVFNINDDNLKKSHLILAGDIGNPYDTNYWDFLRDCSQIFAHVIFITGNHEYYNKNIDLLIIDNYIKSESLKINNLHFLQQNSITINNIMYIGCTMWSSIPKENKKDVEMQMNDYNLIFNFNVNRCNLIHEKHKLWLTNEVNNNNCCKKVVITHHLPSNKLISKKYLNNPINSAFYSNLEYLMGPNINIWIAGHTHTRHDITIHETRVLVNPIGYSKENHNGSIKHFNL